ncbi:MAG TPA: UPF0175 family protein [Verrucomicrobiota bacterium]|nr:UPF0175 family protein [Verrucomicrobiota bacterium]
MAELTIQYPDDLLVASGKPRKVVEDELRVVLATKLFELGQFSLGQAAELAGMGKVRFMDELGRLRIPVIDLDDVETQEEIRAARGDHHRG